MYHTLPEAVPATEGQRFGEAQYVIIAIPMHTLWSREPQFVIPIDDLSVCFHLGAAQRVVL